MKKIDNILRFTDDLIKINGSEFENHYNEIYPPALFFKNAIYFNYRDYRDYFTTTTDVKFKLSGNFLCDAVY